MRVLSMPALKCALRVRPNPHLLMWHWVSFLTGVMFRLLTLRLLCLNLSQSLRFKCLSVLLHQYSTIDFDSMHYNRLHHTALHYTTLQLQ